MFKWVEKTLLYQKIFSVSKNHESINKFLMY